MTLLDRIRSLQLRAAAADDESKIKSRIGDFETIRSQLDAATTGAARVAAAQHELRSAGTSQGDLEQRRAEIRSLVTDLAAAVNSLSVEAKVDGLRASTRTVVSFFEDSRRSVEAAWLGIRQTDRPEVDDELLVALEETGVDVAAIRRDVDQAEEILSLLGLRSLPERGDYARLVSARALLSSAGERMRRLIDPEVAEIIVRAQADGVPYTELTEDVVSGLRNLGILNRLRVVLT